VFPFTAFFRNLPEPVMTFRLHEEFISAASKVLQFTHNQTKQMQLFTKVSLSPSPEQETRVQRISDVHALVHRLPPANFRVLDILVSHLQGYPNDYLRPIWNSH